MVQAGGEVPTKFYKYRPMNTPEMVERVEKIMVHNEIYFSTPISFNDPFDLKPAFSFDAPPERQREEYLRLSRKYQPYYSETQHNAEADDVMANSLSSENIEKTAEIVQFLHAQALARVGLFCVSTKRDDILMWSHYADSHKGICLEFDGMSPLMAHAQKVIYSHKRIPINSYTDDRMAMLEKAILTKSEQWVYEAEWRLCRYKEGPGPVQYRPTNLTGIVLGALTTKDTVNTIREWVSCRASPMAIYRATTSRQDFELLIEPFN